VNVVSPNPVTNLDFTHALGRALHRPTLLPAPAFALKLAFGEMADSTVLVSERVLPQALSAAGFSFQYPLLGQALEALLTHSRA
jgi:NAD dependent epimerase/dehydratase family enzyme